MNKKFLYQIEKEEQDEGILLRLFEVDEKLKSSEREILLPYTLIINKEGFEGLKIESEDLKILKNCLNKDGISLLHLEFKKKDLYEYVRGLAKDLGIRLYEEDLNPEHRYLIDNSLSLYESSEKSPAKLNYLSLDIETIGEPENQEITLISLLNRDRSVSKVLMNPSFLEKKRIEEIKKKKYSGFELEVFSNEKELLERFFSCILEEDYQLLLGWNVVDFDFKVIKERAKFHEIEFKLSKFPGDAKLRLNSDFFRSSTLSAPGVLVWDLIAVLKTNFFQFEDFKLNTVAREILGDSKIALENDENADEGISEKIKVIEEMFKKQTEKLIEYNFKDSLLTAEIFEKTQLGELMYKRSILTGTLLQKVKSPIASLDMMYLKELHKKDLVAESNFNYSDTSPIEGAYVLNPKQGFYSDIFVFDFKSLYPSIIMTFNIDPFTYTEKGEILAPNGASFKRNPGILPELIRILTQERDLAKKEKDKVKSLALKTTMNSFYGALASPMCRFYNKDIAEAITSFGREIILKTKEVLEENNYEVIYGDTDSLFVHVKKKFKSLEEKKEEGRTIEKKLNSFFDTWIFDTYAQKSFLVLEHEKVFSSFFIASKKRYVGYDELSEEMIFVGMEAIRGDWTELAQDFQRELVDLIFAKKEKKEIESFIFSYIDQLKKGHFDSKLVYKKKITKALNQYTKTTPPHVRAARELHSFSGRTVRYVMTKEGPKHVLLLDKEKPNYDYEHYIEKQLGGVSDDLLNSLGIDFEEMLSRKKQKSLEGFF